MTDRSPFLPPRTLLVVDDQPSVCASLAYLLDLAGFRVATAGSGAAALAVAAERPVDGALVDIHMPGWDGFAVALRLQEQARAAGRELRVWFMTGADARRHARRGAELGACGVLAKPFEWPGLQDTLSQGFSVPVPAPVSPAGEPAAS